MKKVMVFILLGVMLCSVAQATSVDLSGMNVAELLELRSAINQELLDRGEMKSATVLAGKYTIGEEIPAGDYSISTDQVLVSVLINEYEEMYVVTPESGVGKTSLKSGDTFEVSGSIVLTKYAGLNFE